MSIKLEALKLHKFKSDESITKQFFDDLKDLSLSTWTLILAGNTVMKTLSDYKKIEKEGGTLTVKQQDTLLAQKAVFLSSFALLLKDTITIARKWFTELSTNFQTSGEIFSLFARIFGNMYQFVQKIDDKDNPHIDIPQGIAIIGDSAGVVSKLAEIAQDSGTLAKKFPQLKTIEGVFGYISDVLTIIGNAMTDKAGNAELVAYFLDGRENQHIPVEEILQNIDYDRLQKDFIYRAENFADALIDFIPDGLNPFQAVHRYGDERDNTLQGRNKDDFLQGLDGNDTLRGLQGNDWLSGGRGNDKLYGGEDNDVYIDVEGNDSYYVEDFDTIHDNDGQGKIFLNNIDITSLHFTRLTTDFWQNKDVYRNITIQAYKSNNDLYIEQVGTTHKVLIKDYFSLSQETADYYQMLGVLLEKAYPEVDFNKFSTYGLNPVEYNIVYPNAITGGISIIGGKEEDLIFSSGNPAKIETGDGNDRMYGSTQSDFLKGGSGNDIIYGSSIFWDSRPKTEQPKHDDDFIYGGEGSDLIAGITGNDIIHSEFNTPAELEQASVGTGMGDWVLGGHGNDQIYGSHKQDFLQGGADADVIYGGAGDDVMLGDGHVRFNFEAKPIYNLSDVSVTYQPVYANSGLGATYVGSVNKTPAEYMAVEHRLTSDGWTAEQVVYRSQNNPATFDWSIGIKNHQSSAQINIDYDIKTVLKLAENQHIVYSDEANDSLFGGLGNDLIIGQYGNDTLFGGEGNDILFGDDNRDLNIIGNDTLNGGKGNDKLYGGRGSDYLIASEGQDILDGGDDYDFYVFDYPALQDGLDKTIVDKQGQGQLSIAGADWASKTWLNIDLNDKNNPDPYLAQDSALRSRLQDAPTWTDGTGSFIQVVGGELHIISRYFNSKIMIQSDEIQLGDGQTESRLPFNFKLESAKKNTAPEVANQYDDQLVTAGKAFSLLLANDLFNDADGDELNYQVSLANGQPLPTWLQFDANSKTLSGTAPSQSQVALKITATDPDGETAEQTFNLRTNSAPEVANQYSDQVVIADKVFNFALPNDLFNDADGDELNYQVSLANGQALPTWLQFDANSKTLSGTAPSQSQVALKITATDNYGETAEQTFNLRTNSAPELAEAFSPQYIVQPQRARQQVWTYQTAKHFKDIDQDQLQYSVHIKSAPSGITSQAVSINSSTGVLSLNQSFLQAGKYQLDITATDPHGQSYTATADINLVAPVSSPIAQISPQADIFNHIGFQQPSLFNPVRQAKGGETHGYFFNDNIQGIANQAHQISGKAGNDKLYGANLNDVLSGDAGHDTLYGLQGNDTLSGGLGNDILVGGQGNDVLIGGDGNDMYFYQRGDGLDYLIDTQGVDTLDLSQGRISLNDVLLKLDESNHKNAIVSFKHHQQSNNENEQLYIENWANAIEYIKTTEGIFDFKQLMQTVI